jgi:DNA-binding response OmpR family regulator/DNA-binding CsgD family transcriptional regulator
MTAEISEREIVLVVDDVPESLAVLSDALDDAGYKVLIAVDGKSAIERIDIVTPDIILLDAVMPGMDGFETCRRIKSKVSTREIPIVFMTGLTETEHVVRGFAAGGVDYVTKPIHPDEVLARIRAHLHTARMMRQARDVVDAAGLAIVVADASWKLAWQTQTARDLLRKFFSTTVDGTLPQALIDWATIRLNANVEADRAPMTAVAGPDQLSIHCLGRSADTATVLLLREGQAVHGDNRLREELKLTARELEVLAWLAKGKTNRDIAEILGMSHRTVNKHLEHIYVKLGVETRTAAAAFAMSNLPNS